ncbi:MAG: SNF2-related protein [Acidimicrobiia bacterium]|nr:SNF2-related protein [Acidimicrobiia bacterium]
MRPRGRPTGTRRTRPTFAVETETTITTTTSRPTEAPALEDLEEPGDTTDAPVAAKPRPSRQGLPRYFTAIVAAEAAGEATPDEIALLESHAEAWTDEVRQQLWQTERALARVRAANAPERFQVINDFEAERRNLLATLSRLVGVDLLDDTDDDAPEAAPASEPARSEPVQQRARPVADDVEPLPGSGVARLQLSWASGGIVAWAGGPDAPAADVERLREMLAEAGAPSGGWTDHPPVTLPTGDQAPALSVPVSNVLGWLVVVGARPADGELAPSVRWLGRVAALAVRFTAEGRVVPMLRQSKRTKARTRKGERSATGGTFAVRWMPVLTSPSLLNDLAVSLPGTVSALEPNADAKAVARSALAGIVHAICRTGASRLEVPAPPPQVRTTADIAETVLARLDGTAFEAPTRPGAELVARLERWARPVATGSPVVLIVQLDPPDSGGAWMLRVLASGVERQPVPVEVALVTGAGTRKREVEDHLARLERLLPVLRRPGGQRRGEVVLSQDEAWELMSRTGDTLAAAGFEVRLPALSRRRPTAALRLFAETNQPSVVGAHQLANVRWTAIFDDVELDAAAIARLSAQARPLIRSRGRWVALDHADLAEAAAALAERAKTTQMTGADMLRHALGLEGTALAGGLQVEGDTWASELLRSAAQVSKEPAETPSNFGGKLRTYQAEALGWLGFLTSAGLGGCLALDMGLGKTPTILAHLLNRRGEGPSIVVAPPAVVGNWARESGRFAPGLKVLVHHGPSRHEGRSLLTAAAKVDVVLTTYGTAVRDIDTLTEMTWDQVVLDEAQVIKNPASETAQQLRRLQARTKVALTGTPIENGLGDLWAILDFANPGLVGPRPTFVAQLSGEGNAQANGEAALRALNGILVFRRTKAEPAIAAELPDRIDELDQCSMTQEQIGLYQAVLDELVVNAAEVEAGTGEVRKGAVLAAITALKQICNHPSAYEDNGEPLDGRSGKLARLMEIIEQVYAAGERVLVFTHFAEWGVKLAAHLTEKTGTPVACYHGGLSRSQRDQLVADFQAGKGAGAMVLSLKAGGTGLNLTAASHVVLYDRWWNPAVEDQARDRVWRIGQTKTVICHRLVCTGTVDERVEEVVAGKRRIADMVLPKSSSLGDLDASQLRAALGLRTDELLTEDEPAIGSSAGADSSAGASAGSDGGSGSELPGEPSAATPRRSSVGSAA